MTRLIIETVQSQLHPYSYYLGDSVVKNIDWSVYSFFVIDKNISTVIEGMVDFKFAEEKSARIFYVDATEHHKSLSTLEAMWQFFADAGMNRTSRILVLGGGMLHDIGALACAFYMRGIQWDYVPTTLVAMVDACLGGKAAINYHHTKNLIGTIYPPTTVYIDVTLAKTLQPAQLISGYAEMVKTAFVGGEATFLAYFHTLEKNNSTVSMTTDCLIDLIHISLFVKKQLIEQDEYDLNVRQYLNFGHTFAHAIESATRYKIDHGVAVAFGMQCALRYTKIFLEYETEYMRQLDLYLEYTLWRGNELLNINFIDYLKEMTWDVFYAAFMKDKKHLNEQITLILPKMTDCDVPFVVNNYGVEKVRINNSDVEKKMKDIFIFISKKY